MILIEVPTLNDDKEDFDYLFRLWGQLKGYNLDVIFDFSQCSFLRQNAVAFLGGLIRSVQSRHGHVQIGVESITPAVRMNLKQNGFLAALGLGTSSWDGNSIPYREDRTCDPEALMDYVLTKWLGRGWLNLSSALAYEIAGTVWEIYSNAFWHAKSSIGIFSCGQHYPKMAELRLTVCDFGIGIPRNVRAFADRLDMTADSAMRWAFKQGNSTKPAGTAGGEGLDILKSFIRANRGTMEVYSHDGYAVIDESGEQYHTRDPFFEGTLINLAFKCHEAYYSLSTEVSNAPWF